MKERIKIMSKSKKQQMKALEIEGKYERMCQEYRERDELERLNRKTRERVEVIEAELQARMAYEQIVREKQERRINAIVQLIVTVILTLAGCVSLGVIAWVEVPLRPVMMILSAAWLLAGTFRSGYSWYAIKN